MQYSFDSVRTSMASVCIFWSFFACDAQSGNCRVLCKVQRQPNPGSTCALTLQSAEITPGAMHITCAISLQSAEPKQSRSHSHHMCNQSAKCRAKAKRRAKARSHAHHMCTQSAKCRAKARSHAHHMCTYSAKCRDQLQHIGPVTC